MKILVVEDNPGVLNMLEMYLNKHRFVVETAANGQAALDKVRQQKYDALVLDLMLPEKNGFEVITALRCLKNQTPILVVSALGAVEDRVKALNLGADDYLVKDFSLSELLARLNRLIRRSDGESKNLLFCNTLTLDLSDMTVRRQGEDIQLTKKEFVILVELLRKKNKVVATADLITAAWGEGNNDVLSNKLNVHVRSLRKKVDDPFDKALVQTVRGFGYKLCDA